MNNASLFMTLDFSGFNISGFATLDNSRSATVRQVSASRMEVLIDSQMIGETRTINGETFSQQLPSSLLDIPLVAERDGDRWDFRLAEGVPDGSQALELQVLSATTTDDDAMFPAAPVEPGSSWPMNAAQLTPFFGAFPEDLAGSSEMTLVKVTQYRGHRCARLRFSMNVTARTIILGNPTTQTIKATGEIYRSLEIFENLTVQQQGTMKITNPYNYGGESALRTVEGPFTATANLRAAAE
jgi:hypothetical protein